MQIEDLERVVSGVADTTGAAVVGVGGGRARGSGIVVAAGKVMTNAHNLHGTEVTVWFGDEREAMGEVTGADVDGDLAVIDVDTGDAAPIEWASVEPSLGMAVVALARPGGQPLRATLGLVSSTGRSFRGPRGRRITGSVEHTAPLRPGSSGGPIVDSRGALVGVNTNRLGDGFYLAIPAGEPLRARIDSLKRGDEPARLRLGIGVAPAHVARGLRRAVGLQDREGLLVRGVEDGGPADRAGMREGDLIVEVKGAAIAAADDLLDALDGTGVSEPLTVKLVRGDNEQEVVVSFEE